MNLRRLLWTALGGVMLGVLGVFWDKAWHSRHAGEDLSGAAEVVEAHWLMILGILIIFVALMAAVRLVEGLPRSAVFGTWVAFAGSVLMVVGFAWDSVRHIQGAESSTAHAMIYGGLVLVVVAIPAALALSRGPAASATR